MLKICAIALMLFSPLTSLAQSVSAPSLETATTAWLNGDDAEALPALSALAHAGNETAAIFLARIERSSSLTSSYVNSLTRAQRIALFRTPGGLSGTSWLTVLAEKNPLAKAFQDSSRVNKRLGAVTQLMALGERRASLVAFFHYTHTRCYACVGRRLFGFLGSERHSL